MLDWFYDKVLVKKEIIALLYGRPKSGRSTVLDKMSDRDEEQKRCIGIQMVTFYRNRNKFTLWDMCSNAERYEMTYQRFFNRCRSLVYVVDSTQKKVLEQCRDELHEILQKEMMAGCALLVIATKQDLADAVSLELIQQVFELSKLRQPWKLIATTINDKKTLAEGFDWLAQTSP